MNIILTSVEDALADAWERFCGDLDFVTVHRGSIFDLSCDAVVSPANSFGFMDGGIDMLYTQHFGWGVQERLQEAIREDHHGELLVGAALLLVRHGTFTRGTYAGEQIADFVDSLAFPGLGTGVGRVGPNTCARQVRAAIDAVVLGCEVFPVSWVDAQRRHQGLCTDRVRDLQQE